MVNRTIDDRLRALLGESVPTGGSDTDTMFSDDEVEDFLEQGGSGTDQIYIAAYWGWIEKAANYANLVNVNEGNAARELGELFTHAQAQIRRYEAYVPTPGRGRARMGNIGREGLTF